MRSLLFSSLLFSIFVANNTYSQTWSDGVGKLFQQSCVQCHSPGGVAPFSLTSFDDVAPFATLIQEAVNSGEMPPWTPDPEYKEFAHQRVLDQAEITMINDWVDNGAPEGNTFEAPSVATFPVGSQLGTPDLTLTIPTYTVTSNNDVYYNFELPSGLAEAMYANAVEIIPGNTDVVHHVLVFQDSTNNPINPISMGGTGSSASKLIYAYIPGAQPYYAPSGAGFRMPADTRVILQIHYAPGSQGQTDATTVNFKLTNGPQREVIVDPILNHSNMSNGPLFIPANQTATFNQDYTSPINATLLYVFPHMHLIGRSIKSWGNLPVSNDTVRFIDIPEWDFHWQDNFIFPNTVTIPSGTIFRSEAVYDNTVNNPHNPSDPPQNVSVGEGTNDEMMYVFFAYMPYQAGDEYIIVNERIFPKGATTVCQGEEVLLTAIEGVGYTYQWYLDGNAISGATNSTYSATIAGSYTLEINLGPNTTLSEPVDVVVNTLPTVSITQPTITHIATGGSILLEASDDPSLDYQWYLDGIAINGATGSTHNATLGGDYFVTVFDGCYAVSETINLSSEAGVNELEENRFIVYPNPANEVLSIVDKKQSNYAFEITDILGKQCMKGTLDGIMTKIDVSQLKSGTYFVEINNQTATTNIKFVIE